MNITQFTIFTIFSIYEIAFSQITPNFKLQINTELYKETNYTNHQTNVNDTINGPRSKESIMYIVMKNLPQIRKEYNKQLKKNRKLEGTITTKFAINDSGKVIFADVIETTVYDVKFERQIIDILKMWKFDAIEAKGNITEVVYPFIFNK